MMTALRWLLVATAPVLVWHAVLLAGLLGVAVLDGLCPPEARVSSVCTAPWHGPTVHALMLACSALAAFGIVVVPALLAPAHRFRVALVVLGGGGVLASWLALDGGVWGPFAAAAAGGGLGLRAAARRWRGEP